jgi:uncharacterized RDD family membrane protein YckC
MREREYGSFSLRFFAWMFDQILLWLIPIFLLALVVSSSDSVSRLGLGTLWVVWELVFIQWLLRYLYLIGTFLLFRASLGKMLAGLAIEKEDGTKPNLVDGLMRFVVGYTVSGILWGLGYLWIIKDPKKKGFHDHFAGTVVVKSGPSWPISVFLPILILVAGLIIFLMVNSGVASGLWTAVGKDLSDFYQVLMNLSGSGAGEKI